MARARLVGLTKTFGRATALADFSLDLEEGELVVVVGPSGCGKSTLLRLIAGLDAPSAGEVYIGDRRVDGVAPQHRDVAMVFQSYALYPHMTVRRNIEFPLRMRGVKRNARRARAEELADLLEIAPLLDRKPNALSGGQRQRVALARALVRKPALFLLDEPLSNLDAQLRTSVRQHIRALQRRLGVTTIYVTHDQTEAMTLGHRVVVLDRGRTQMIAPPLAAYERPANTFVARFLGAPPMNLIDGVVEGDSLIVGPQRVALSAETVDAVGSGPVRVGVRAEAFAPASQSRLDAAHLVARPDYGSVELLGSDALVSADLGGTPVVLRVPSHVDPAVTAFVAPLAALHFFAADGRRIAP